eukprot:GHVH01004560.1.p1 GENE.GHVH01004560.1~~GHVH01004560.1.p1  ORF type:complete len:129 (+),score=16.42 GHVH01004560.1:59-445(+)
MMEKNTSQEEGKSTAIESDYRKQCKCGATSVPEPADINTMSSDQLLDDVKSLFENARGQFEVDGGPKAIFEFDDLSHCGCGAKFQIDVKSSVFKSIRMLERNRMVNNIVEELLNSGAIHAVVIKTGVL